jgi:type VI secretion system protein ImpI
MGLGFRVRYRSNDGGVYGEREVTQLPVRFGRNAMNDCVIEHPQVSQFHAVVELIDGQVGVRDLNSKNGVYTASSGRLQAGRFLPLASTGNVFSLGPSVHVQIESFDHAPQAGVRMSPVQGQVLGRPSMLEELGRAQQGSAPPVIRSSPPLDASRGVVSLPPLSMDGSGAPQRPPPQPMAWNPGAPGSADDRSSLPPLDPLSSAYASPPLGGPAPYPSPGGPPPYPSPGGPAPYPSPGRPAGARAVSRSTQQFAMTVDALALTGLRELASSIVPGVPLQTTGDVARLITKLHDTVEMFCRCFVPLRTGYEQFVSSMHLRRAAGQRSVDRSPSALRLEVARDPATVAAALLDWRNQDYDAPKVVESILADLVMHHVALVESVMRGVQALLDELSPENIERALAESGSPAVLGRHRALWQAYKDRHHELATESRTFALVFGDEFAAAYREYLEQQRTPER